MKKKEVFLLWSGGLDSTFMIQTLLDSNPNVKVTAGYVELLNNYNKTKMEKAAIQKLLPILQKKYSDRFVFLDTIYKAQVCSVGTFPPLKQLPVWISALMECTPETTNEVCIGYVMNDCAISYLQEIKSIFKAYSKFTFKKFPKVTFPLSKIPKSEIVIDLDKELKAEVVWCENPIVHREELKPCEDKNMVQSSPKETYSPCGHCASCEHSPLLPKRKLETVSSGFVETINNYEDKQIVGCDSTTVHKEAVV
jgi:7-cyano-7-deazaguanine synthase in queuosine biosynthesis